MSWLDLSNRIFVTLGELLRHIAVEIQSSMMASKVAMNQRTGMGSQVILWRRHLAAIHPPSSLSLHLLSRPCLVDSIVCRWPP